MLRIPGIAFDPFIDVKRMDDLSRRQHFSAILCLLIERSDGGEPIVLAGAVQVSGVFAETAYRFGELGRLFAGDCAGHAEPGDLDTLVG